MKRLFVLSAVTLLALLPVIVFSGTTGKLTGRVFDKETGNPLPFANVILEGTGLGAVTDMEGRYFILNVRPGTYTVIARYVGYNDFLKTEVRVFLDQTTVVDYEMTQIVLEMKQIIRTEARPVVDVKAVAPKRYVTREKIQRLPVTRFEEVLEISPGFVRGGAGDELHVRGGRGGEILYLVDGIPIKNPLIGGGFGMRIGTNAIEEMEILTGGFSPEFGDVQSAVINVITREGSANKTTRRLYYKTDDLGSPFKGSSWNTDRVEFSMGGPDNFIPNLLRSAFGLNLKGVLTYFVSADGEWTDTPRSFPKKIYTRQKYDLVLFGDPVSSVTFADRQQNLYTWNVKSVYKFTPSKKLTLAYRGSREREHLYKKFDHIYRFLPENGRWRYENGDQESISWNHVLGGSKTFYNLRLSRFMTFENRNPANKTPGFFEDGFSLVFPRDLDGDGFYDRGYDQFVQWRQARSTVWTGKLDATSQFHPNHEGKAGMNLIYHVEEKKEIQYAYRTYDGPPDEGEYPDQGVFRDFYTRTPTLAALYVQDKIETEGMIVRLGLRYDLFYPGKQSEVFIDPTTFDTIDVNVKHNISPRLGISHPITDRANLYFNFGWFYQVPEFQYIFRAATQSSSAFTFYGNPDLGFEKTVLYELGVQQGVGDHWRMDVKGFFKDIRGLVDLEKRGQPPLVGHIFENLDYGNARGVEITVDKRYSNYTSGSLTYTLAWAQGKSSSDRQNYDNDFFGRPIPVREHPLDWDQRHNIIADLDYRIPGGDHPRLFGLKLPDRWGVTLLTNYHSGLPYTPAVKKGELAIPNSGRIPAFITWDMKGDKSFKLGSFNYSFIVEVLNLFNKRNVKKVHDDSGRPDTPDPEREGYEPKKAASGFYANPWNWYPGRHLSLGVSVAW
ncbi:TonB-dependent receptor [candidate division TA06 bacterium]|nr:TonB-dependent receptor [candidate division TA06 bacterium]